MKTIFIPLLIPFFNYGNKVIGAVRIYRGLVIIDNPKGITCNENILTLSCRGKKVYAYVELEKPPLLKTAMKFAENVLSGEDICDSNPFVKLFNSEGAVVANPPNIIVDKYNTSEVVLVAILRETINNIPVSKMVKSFPQDFTSLSQQYSQKYCEVNFFSKISEKYACTSSCINENMFFLVKRKALEKIVKELILKSVDPDEINVLGLIDKNYVIYERSPHTQNVS